MAPKALPPAAKQALILKWFHSSGTAHSLKDLEKALPSIASINGIQVKDYLQALSDENQIRVEKIGSGNWYWSFPSEATKEKEKVLAQVEAEREKAAALVEELRAKVEEASAAREEDDDMLEGGEEEGRGDRKTLLARHVELVKGVEMLGRELAGYSENDPVEVEKKILYVLQCKVEAEKWTEGIQSMEGWFKEQMGGDREQLLGLMRSVYGDEFDEEEQNLREL